MKNKIEKFEYFCKNIEQEVEKEIKRLNAKKTTDDIIINIEGPLIIFQTLEIEYRIEGMKFKENSNKKKYNNLLGSNAIVVSIDETGDIKKFEKAFDSVVGLLKSEIYAGDLHCYLKML